VSSSAKALWSSKLFKWRYNTWMIFPVRPSTRFFTVINTLVGRATPPTQSKAEQYDHVDHVKKHHGEKDQNFTPSKTKCSKTKTDRPNQKQQLVYIEFTAF
jgi:hypothetical protein